MGAEERERGGGAWVSRVFAVNGAGGGGEGFDAVDVEGVAHLVFAPVPCSQLAEEFRWNVPFKAKRIRGGRTVVGARGWWRWRGGCG